MRSICPIVFIYIGLILSRQTQEHLPFDLGNACECVDFLVIDTGARESKGEVIGEVVSDTPGEAENNRRQ